MSYQANTVIRDFANYNPSQLDQTRLALGLRMPPNAFAACAAYYKKTGGKRDPILDELRLLDALATLSPQPEQIVVRELFTNDAFVADTYSDMMNKRRELNPNAQNPISVREAFELASAYLTRVGNAPKKNVPVALTDAGALTNAQTALANGASHTLVLGETQPTVSSGDLLLLVYNLTLPDWKFRDAWDRLFADASFRNLCKRAERISSAGILPLLLKQTNGAFLAMDRLASQNEEPSMCCLVGAFEDCHLLILPENNREAAVQALKNAELGISVFGYVTADSKIGIALSQATPPITFDSAFLRSLLLRVPATAKLPNEPRPTHEDRIAHTVSEGLTSAYVQAAPLERTVVDNTEIASAHCQTEQGFFRSALYTTLTPILSLSAAGGAYNELGLAATLSLPAIEENAEKLGEAIAAILGFYRAQTEMGTPAVRLSVEKNKELSHPALTVYSLAAATRQPASFVASGHTLYCVAAPTNADGLPQFDALRGMLSNLKALHERGAIAAQRVISNETVYAALTAMETEALGYRLAENAVVGAPLSLAILFESAEELPFAKVGTVEAREISATDTPEQSEIPAPAQALTYNGKTEAVVLSKTEDFDAVSLTEILRRASVRVTHIPTNAEPVEIARAILTAQVVFLCNTGLPRTPAVDLACRTLQASGGALIGLGENAELPDLPLTFRFIHGLPQKEFTDLFEKRENPTNL